MEAWLDLASLSYIKSYKNLRMNLRIGVEALRRHLETATSDLFIFSFFCCKCLRGQARP